MTDKIVRVLIVVQRPDRMKGDGLPAAVVDRAGAEHLEVLRLVPLRCACVVEAVQHADALDGALVHAVDRNRFGQSCRLEDCGRHVDDVMELRADFAFRLDGVGPVHDGAVTCSAPMRRNLLGPLVGRVHRMRPADGVVVVRLRPAELVEPRHQEFGGFQRGKAIEVGHLVVGAVDRALG